MYYILIYCIIYEATPILHVILNQAVNNLILRALILYIFQSSNINVFSIRHSTVVVFFLTRSAAVPSCPMLSRVCAYWYVSVCNTVCVLLSIYRIVVVDDVTRNAVGSVCD